MFHARKVVKALLDKKSDNSVRIEDEVPTHCVLVSNHTICKLCNQVLVKSVQKKNMEEVVLIWPEIDGHVRVEFWKQQLRVLGNACVKMGQCLTSKGQSIVVSEAGHGYLDRKPR